MRAGNFQGLSRDQLTIEKRLGSKKALNDPAQSQSSIPNPMEYNNMVPFRGQSSPTASSDASLSLRESVAGPTMPAKVSMDIHLCVFGHFDNLLTLSPSTLVLSNDSSHISLMMTVSTDGGQVSAQRHFLAHRQPH